MNLNLREATKRLRRLAIRNRMITEAESAYLVDYYYNRKSLWERIKEFFGNY